MAPQESIPLSASILGLIGTVLWCIQLIPQIWMNWKRKSTEGLPLFMICLWIICQPPFGAYAIIQNFNIPVQIQPNVFSGLALVSFAQICVYHHHWQVWKAVVTAVTFGAICGSVEVALVLGLRGPYNRGVSWPVTLVGVIAAMLVAVGLLPVYYEMWKRKGRVVGISFIFLFTDWNGAFFSLVSLGVQQSFDIIGGTLYIVFLTLETGIAISHLIWLARSRSRNKMSSKTDDEEECQQIDEQESSREAVV